MWRYMPARDIAMERDSALRAVVVCWCEVVLLAACCPQFGPSAHISRILQSINVRCGVGYLCVLLPVLALGTEQPRTRLLQPVQKINVETRRGPTCGRQSRDRKASSPAFPKVYQEGGPKALWQARQCSSWCFDSRSCLFRSRPCSCVRRLRLRIDSCASPLLESRDRHSC